MARPVDALLALQNGSLSIDFSLKSFKRERERKTHADIREWKGKGKREYRNFPSYVVIHHGEKNSVKSD
jgi:hypothetical protein